MRVLYQIPGDVMRGPLGGSELRRREALLSKWAAPGIHVDVADAPGGPLSIENELDEALCVAPMIASLRGRQPAPDAVIIGCFGDPGVVAVREIIRGPVVGPFEASLHLAAQLGLRVGVVTVTESVVPMLERLARGMGQSAIYAGAVAIDVPVLELTSAPTNRGAQIGDAARALVHNRGADVLVLGCMSMAFLDIAAEVSDRCGVPVINPAHCALKTAEMLLALGLRHSRQSYSRSLQGNGIFNREAAR